MDEIKTKYLADFERIGRDKLINCGFSYELLPAAPHFPEGFEMLLRKGDDEYLLFFSTHHLDFCDGVIVCRSSDRKIHYELRVLPPLSEHLERSNYAYDIEDIERIIKDICSL